MSRRGITRSKSIIKDKVKASDYNNLNLIYHCEQCSYFEPDSGKCNLGFANTHHLKVTQDRYFNLGGRMAFCRFLEID